MGVKVFCFREQLLNELMTTLFVGQPRLHWVCPINTQYFSHLTHCRSDDDWVVVGKLVTKRTLMVKLKGLNFFLTYYPPDLLLAGTLHLLLLWTCRHTPSIVVDMSSFVKCSLGTIAVTKLDLCPEGNVNS